MLDRQIFSLSKRRVLESSVALVSLTLLLSGCTAVGVQLEDTVLLKQQNANVKTIAILSGAAISVPPLGSERRVYDTPYVYDEFGRPIVEVYVSAITEELQKNTRFHFVTPHQVETALRGDSTVQADQPVMSKSMTAAEMAHAELQRRAQGITKAGRTVKADAVLLIEAERELGAPFVRFTTINRVTLSVISTDTGNVIWRQKAIQAIESSASTLHIGNIGRDPRVTLDFMPELKPELVSTLVQSFNETMK